jgi:hypothetical protein
MKCLHCEISMILVRRQREGETASASVIGKICEVIGDIAASDQAAAPTVFSIAREFLNCFEQEITTGDYQASRQLIEGMH